MDAAQFQQVAKALAEPRRLEILTAIATHDELSCREIVEQFPVSQATVSHHIKELVKVGLIETSTHRMLRCQAIASKLGDILNRGSRCCRSQTERISDFPHYNIRSGSLIYSPTCSTRPLQSLVTPSLFCSPIVRQNIHTQPPPRQ